ncbi:bifunctional non-homologous end joining protein LigD [Thermocatellispora tengchongensis]|uniref:DNA ligase (ATP) n=1 Tax=Thermocatellispora tengchongensis TaxID=1073253 RepID=A0A840P097_9ACTN|nr:non-homologous end-joining DNA ligase [Thermocatellispora tengchongensis]MBB5131331.1 bifunctional non-homologous end joining protein LigD [Thermocatellispora tengchongensis]
MTAQLGELPGGDAYGYEMKWDGVRALAYVEGGAVRLISRNARDITVAYPELAMLAGAVGRHDVVLDGEIVAFDERGRPSFEALQPRMHQRRPARIAELVRAVPVTYLLFDVLHVDDTPSVERAYTKRRDLLEGLVSPGARWQVPVWFPGDGHDAVDFSRQMGLEGVVAKRLDSPYRPGRRSADWIKVKNVRTQEVVIGGWKPGAGRRAGMIGSLLLGVYDGARRAAPGAASAEGGVLVFAGHVGTGFTQAMLRDLGERLAPLARPTSPFAGQVPREHARDAHWVEPELVGEVQYAEWTSEGYLRHPSWRGLRADKMPRDVHPEIPPPLAS